MPVDDIPRAVGSRLFSTQSGIHEREGRRESEKVHEREERGRREREGKRELIQDGAGKEQNTN